MKLGELKTAIRGMKGYPLVETNIGGGKTIWVAVQKGPFMETLTESFEHKNTETGLRFDGLKLVSAVAPAEEVELDLSDDDYILDL